MGNVIREKVNYKKEVFWGGGSQKELRPTACTWEGGKKRKPYYKKKKRQSKGTPKGKGLDILR